jgi:hypothetical protein
MQTAIPGKSTITNQILINMIKLVITKGNVYVLWF